MSYTVTIGSYVIPDADITEFPKSTEQLAFNQRIIPDTYKIVIDNTDKSIYDDRISGSVFYAVDFYGDAFKVFNNELDRYVFTGSVKNISIDDGNNQITIEATTYIDDLSKKTCVYSNSSDKTIAAIIYEILTDAAAGNIDPDFIIYNGFARAIAIQTTNTVYANVTYTAEDKKPVMNVLNELCRIASCNLYCVDNLIHLYQWQEYDGTLGNSIYEKDIISKSYKHEFDDNDIKNSCRITYLDGASVATATGSNTGSITTYGERIFQVPDEDVDSTTATDFKILLRNVTGANYCVTLALLRYAYLKKYCEFRTSIDCEYMKLATVSDLRFYPYYGEPIRITNRQINSDSGEITFKGEFLNTPHSVVTRDTSPPDAPLLISAVPVYGGVCLKWTEDQATDHIGYKIYFTTSKGEWYSEICHRGQSPIDNKSTALSIDGYIYCTLLQLSTGATYYFKVTAYDTSYNESDFSNTLSCTTPLTAENLESCTGNLSVAITLDEPNSMNGTIMSGCLTYADDHYYGSDYYTITAHAESGIVRKASGFTAMSWVAIGDPSDIYFQYRTATTQAGVASASWSTAIDAVSTWSSTISTTNEYLQYRFIFYSPNWSDTDYFYVREIL